MFDRIAPHLTYSNVMVTLLAFIVLGGGGVALGGVIGKQGQIGACYVKAGKHRGKVRLLVKGGCTRREKKLVWNQRGLPGRRGATGPQGPATGPAGGDLVGRFPNPSIAAGAVTGGKIADGAVGSAAVAPGSINATKVLDGSLTGADLGAGSVGGRELGSISRREGTGAVTGGTVGNNVWNHGTATASCLAGEQLIGGNATWDNENAGDPMAIVEVAPDFVANTVTVKGATDVLTDRTLRAIAICLG